MNRTLYFPNSADGAIWTKAQRVARIKGETVSTIVVAALREYIEANESLLQAVDQAVKQQSKPPAEQGGRSKSSGKVA